MRVEVDTRERGGERLPRITGGGTYSTDVFRSVEEQADARVKAVIAAVAAPTRKTQLVAARIQ